VSAETRISGLSAAWASTVNRITDKLYL